MDSTTFIGQYYYIIIIIIPFTNTYAIINFRLFVIKKTWKIKNLSHPNIYNNRNYTV